MEIYKCGEKTVLQENHLRDQTSDVDAYFCIKILKTRTILNVGEVFTFRLTATPR